MRPLRKRVDRVLNQKTKLEETWITLMVETSSGRCLAIWAGKDESLFPESAAGKAWAAGEDLPLKASVEMTPGRVESLRRAQAARRRQDRR